MLCDVKICVCCVMWRFVWFAPLMILCFGACMMHKEDLFLQRILKKNGSDYFWLTWFVSSFLFIYCKTGYFSGHIIFAAGRFFRTVDFDFRRCSTEHSGFLLFYCHIFPISIEIIGPILVQYHIQFMSTLSRVFQLFWTAILDVNRENCENNMSAEISCFIIYLLEKLLLWWIIVF